MRYSARLHISRRDHILKHPHFGRLITLVGFLVILVGAIVFVNLTTLDASQLFGGFVISLARITVAYLVAVVIAITIAIAMTSHPVIEAIFLPLFDVLQSFPSFALFPVLVTALNRAPEVVIVSVLALEIIWPILFSMIGGIKNRRQDLEDAATMFGARGWRRTTQFSLPYLWPSIVTGSIVGWGEAWEFIIGAELLVHVNSGIGHYLGVLGDGGQTQLLSVGIVILMLLLFLINKFVWLNLLRTASQFQTES